MASKEESPERTRARRFVAELIHEHGIQGAALALEASRESLLAFAGGFKIRRATEEWFERRVAERLTKTA